MSKNVFVEAGSFRRLLLGAAGGYELQALVMVSNCLEREFIHRQLATGRPLHLNI